MTGFLNRIWFEAYSPVVRLYMWAGHAINPDYPVLWWHAALAIVLFIFTVGAFFGLVALVGTRIESGIESRRGRRAHARAMAAQRAEAQRVLVSTYQAYDKLDADMRRVAAEYRSRGELGR